MAPGTVASTLSPAESSRNWRDMARRVRRWEWTEAEPASMARRPGPRNSALDWEAWQFAAQSIEISCWWKDFEYIWEFLGIAEKY